MISADGTTFIVSYKLVDRSDNDHLENTDSTSSENEQQSLNNVDRKFLKKFLSGEHCLTGGTGWWQYEICYERHVIQFHVKVI